MTRQTSPVLLQAGGGPAWGRAGGPLSASPCCVRPEALRSCSCWPCLRVSTSGSAAHPGTHFLRQKKETMNVAVRPEDRSREMWVTSAQPSTAPSWDPLRDTQDSWRNITSDWNTCTALGLQDTLGASSRGRESLRGPCSPRPDSQHSPLRRAPS